jgi:hypothetical protein
MEKKVRDAEGEIIRNEERKEGERSKVGKKRKEGK